YASTPGFYEQYQYDRALDFLEWMTAKIHQSDKFRNVGMLELVNEPVQDEERVASMRTSYYPDAFSRVRDTETLLGVSADKYLHLQMMNANWGSGDPTESLGGSETPYAAYDDHRYLKYDESVAVDKDSYVRASCGDDRGGNEPTIVGEWSLSVPDEVQDSSEWDPATNTDFYARWLHAVDAGVIPKDLDRVYDGSPC
ncbi:glycoside hydrolase superfamily, partial [Aspergillus aurantiobrunneus]